MNNNTLSYEEYQKKVSGLKTLTDVTNFAKELIAPTLQKMLEAELDEHLGYKKHDPSGRNSGNSRNGFSQKKLKTSFGQENLNIPRDRNGSFEPIAVRKYETIESDVEEKIVAMYAKGLTTRDIAAYMHDIYGIEVSPTMISSVTDKILPLLKEWQTRPLSSLYPIIYLDGLHFKVRENGKIMSKCAYIILGINDKGMKEVLGIWTQETEGAKFWLQILSEIKQRGTNDILIASIDGLSGFSEAIRSVFPETRIQQCIVHQVRNTLKYIPHKHKKEFISDLKNVYGAINEEAGLEALDKIKAKWPQYSLYLKSWYDKWAELKTFFEYPEALRRIMYTTNAIENLNRQFRKVTKTTVIFPHDEALQKLLFLACRDISKKWTAVIRNWGEIISQLAILFPEKIRL